MKIQDVQYEDFTAWMGMLEDSPMEIEKYMLQAIDDVPLIERLMVIHENAFADNAPHEILQKIKGYVNVLITLFHISNGLPKPTLTSVENCSENNFRNEACRVEEILVGDEIELLRKTMKHFLDNPDYATGEEEGVSFSSVSFGDPLPLEIVIRDWVKELEGGTGGLNYKKGDCFLIYKKLYEKEKNINFDFSNIIQ